MDVMQQALLFLVLSTVAVASAIADEVRFPHVTVYGTATTEIVPDQMVWSVKVQNRGRSLEVTATEHTKLVQAALELIKDAVVDKADIQTSSMEFGENWEEKADTRVRAGYLASTTISFKTTKIEAYKSLWLGLAKISGISVEDIAYDHTKRMDIQNETRQKALLAAKEKAMTLAKTLGAGIGEPLSIEEDVEVHYRYIRNTNLREDTAGGPVSRGDLALGRIPITMRIKASFRLVSFRN